MKKCAGYIEFVMVDETNNLILELGGAGFETPERLLNEWEAIEVFEGHTAFVADKKDSEGSIVEDKNVCEETITMRLGKPISELISEARKRALEENSMA
ncbi:hypothetical protein OKZ62_001880 [Vibrio navarrensis]|nr:hypothetical protein [Vibrio navarrensis]